MENIKSKLEDYAKDTKLNISSVLSEEGAPGLTLKQIAGTALTSAWTLKNDEIAVSIQETFGADLSDDDVFGIKAAVSLMAMNNIYYRYVHLSEDEKISKKPAKLRMNVMRDPRVPKVDFELYSLAASSINGCGMCIQAHNNSLRGLDVSDDGIQSVARIASVIHALDQSLYLEKK